MFLKILNYPIENFLSENQEVLWESVCINHQKFVFNTPGNDNVLPCKACLEMLHSPLPTTPD